MENLEDEALKSAAELERKNQEIENSSPEDKEKS